MYIYKLLSGWAILLLCVGDAVDEREQYEVVDRVRRQVSSSATKPDPSSVDDLWKLPPDTSTFNDTIVSLIDEEVPRVQTDHQYYKMEILSNKPDLMKQYYVNVEELLNKENVKGNKSHPLLTNSYRRAVSAKISFDFPFYGHRMRNLTIATGGFSYIGDQTHSWLAATQYIAPLMANFETTAPNANILNADDGNRFIIEWKNVVLRDQKSDGPFTFQVILHKNGDIHFVYKDVPISVANISDSHHPCKLGISDAYLFHHSVISHYTTALSKRVIYEYHRIEVPVEKVVSNTIVILHAQPTCISLSTCTECSNVTLTHFNCSWCHSKKSNGGPFCTDQAGLHRRRQQWIEGNCKDQGKNMYCSTDEAEDEKFEEQNSEKDSDESDDDDKQGGGGDGQGGKTDAGGDKTGGPDQVVPLDSHPRPSTAGGRGTTANADSKDAFGTQGNGYMAVMTLLLSVFVIGGWLLYAYYNPHSTSGQLLIRYRPSRWRVPSSHVRYSASVHM